MKKILLPFIFLFVSQINSQNLFSEFNVGVGDGLNFDNPVGSSNYTSMRRITEVLESHGVNNGTSGLNAKFIAMWMQGYPAGYQSNADNNSDGVPDASWQKIWFPASDVQTYVLNKGYIPVFIHWWFGDDTRPSTVANLESAYYADLARVGQYLSTMEGKVLFVFEPEYNTPFAGDSSIKTWAGWSTVLLKGKQTIENAINAAVAARGDTRKITVSYGTSPGDWDTAVSLQPSMGQFINGGTVNLGSGSIFVSGADFIGTESIYASTSSFVTQSDALKAGQNNLNRLKDYYALYHKPTMVTNFAISTYDTTTSTGWSETQAQSLSDYSKLQNQFINEAGTFAVLYMALTDNPNHHGFYGQAEYHLGLLDTSFGKKTNTTSLGTAFDIFFGIPRHSLATPFFDGEVKTIVFIQDNKFFVKSSKNINTVEIFDITGRKIGIYDAINNPIFSSQFHYAKGIYLVKIKTEDGTIVTQKLVN